MLNDEERRSNAEVYFEASRIYRRFLRSTGYLRCWMRPWRTWRAGAVLLPFPMRRFGKTEPRAQYNTKDFAGKCLEHLREMQCVFCLLYWFIDVAGHRGGRRKQWQYLCSSDKAQQLIWRDKSDQRTKNTKQILSVQMLKGVVYKQVWLSVMKMPHTQRHTQHAVGRRKINTKTLACGIRI